MFASLISVLLAGRITDRAHAGRRQLSRDEKPNQITNSRKKSRAFSAWRTRISFSADRWKCVLRS